MKVLVSVGGASGSIYANKLIEELKKHDDVELHIIFSENAKKIFEHEIGKSYKDVVSGTDYYYENNNLFCGPASGSFELDAMIIIPCSLKTLSAVGHSYADNLTSRSAICCLKEGKKLILVVRETPLDLSSIKNMLYAKENGAVILPASPGFYHQPKNLNEIVDYIVGKVIDQINIPNNLFKRWD
jgi:4-hydroxy-3-polyprenylbenzoate decarboxylase